MTLPLQECADTSSAPAAALERLGRVLQSRPITLRVPQVYNNSQGNPWGQFADDLAALVEAVAIMTRHAATASPEGDGVQS